MPIDLTSCRVVFLKKCNKSILSLGKKDQRHLQNIMSQILKGIIKPDIKKMQGAHYGYYRLRIGDYRLLFYYDTKDHVVIFMKCEHRKDAYKH